MFAFVVLLILSNFTTGKLESNEQINTEVISMKIRTISNLIISSLTILGAIGVNILSACLLA